MIYSSEPQRGLRYRVYYRYFSDLRYVLPQRCNRKHARTYNNSNLLSRVHNRFAYLYNFKIRSPNQRYFIVRITIDSREFPHSTVILKEYFENVPLKSCNIAKIFIKLLERFLKYCRNLAMSVQNIINGILLQY